MADNLARLDRIERALDTLVPMVATLVANQTNLQGDMATAKKEHKEALEILRSRLNKLSLVLAGLITSGGVALKAGAAPFFELWKGS